MFDLRLDRRWSADVDAVASIRYAVRSYAYEAGAGRELVDDVALAVTEAATNAVVHAKAATIGILGVREDHSLHFEVADDGSGMAPVPRLEHVGLGLPIIARLADELRIGDAVMGGTLVVMRFRLTS